MKALLAFAITAIVVAGPGLLSSATAQNAAQATIVDFDFQPKELTVDVGATVTWRNTGARPHTVTDRGGTFDSNPIAPRGRASVTFTVPGRYFYFCRINPGRMNALIVVNPGPQPAKVTRVQTVDPARDGETLRFDPSDLTVEAGSTLVVANVGGKPHTLTADDGSFDSGVVTPGAEGGRFAGANASLTVSKPGRYAFHCEVHPQAMKGVLNVTGEERAPPVSASTAPTKLAIDAKDFEFDPGDSSIAPNGEVTFTNRGQARHTLTLDDVQLDTNVVEPGGAALFRAPEKPGSYSYRCNVHPARMRGVLVVVGQSTEDPTQVAAAAAPQPPAKGPGGGVATLALVTLGIGAFLGGFAISAFVRNQMGAANA